VKVEEKIKKERRKERKKERKKEGKKEGKKERKKKLKAKKKTRKKEDLISTFALCFQCIRRHGGWAQRRHFTNIIFLEHRQSWSRWGRPLQRRGRKPSSQQT